MDSAFFWWTTAVVLVLCRGAEVKEGRGLVYKSCGPPFKLTVSPNPPKIRQAVNLTLEIVAAHDLIAGTFEAYGNFWPYHYKDVYCADGKTVDPQGCYIRKGDKRVISTTLWIDDSFKEAHYVGNATLRNENNELLVCIQGYLDM